METIGMQAAEPSRNDAGPREGLSADDDEPLIVVHHDGTRRYFSPQCKEQWRPDIIQLCLGLGADEELLGIRQGARAWVISEGKFIPPLEEHLMLSGTFVALVRAIPPHLSPAAATPSQTNTSKGKSAALQLPDFAPPPVGNSESDSNGESMRPNGSAAGNGNRPLSPVKEPAKATIPPNKATKSAYAAPKNLVPKLGPRGRNAPGKAAAIFRIPPAACRKAANSTQGRTRSVVARSSKPSSPYSPAPKACGMKNKAASISKAPSPARLKAPSANAEIEAVDSNAHQDHDIASTSAGKAPISNPTWEMLMATNTHLSSSAVKAPMSNTTWEMLIATNPHLSSPEEQFSQVEGGFLLPDNELPELVAEATRKLEEAAETRRRLHARCQATGKLSVALEEVKRDLQPPGLTQDASQALSHATEALCWSLNACKKTSRLLDDENSAIRCGLRVHPSSPTTVDVTKGVQEGPDADIDSDAEGAGCIGVMTDDEGTMQRRAENRNELRGRLVAHLRDALKMAQEPAAMLTSLPATMDEETASLSHWVINEEDAIDTDIEDDCSSRQSADEADDDAEDFYSAHSSDVEDDTQSSSSVLPPRGRSPLVASSGDDVDDLEGALRRLAEWYKEASERCERAMELCCAPLPDDPGKTRVALEGREDDAGPSAPIEFALEPHQEDPSGDTWFKDPFSDHERRLEDLVRRCGSARDAVERQLEGERECVEGLATQTDGAQRELRILLDAVASSELRQLQSPPKAFVLSAATQAFSAAVAFEEEFAEAACRQSAAQFKLELLRWACEARHGYLCGMAAGLKALIEGLAWAGGILCVQSAALDSEYPPSLLELQGWERRLCENQEDMEQTELDLKFARRRGRDTALLEAKAAELRAVMRADRLDVKIMRERARLYAVAWEHFPELLAPGQPWSRLVGLDAASDALAGLKRRGLLAEGRCFADFVTSERRADDGGKGADEVLIGTRRCVYDATDAEGRRWALKEYSLLGERSRRALWRHLCVLEDLRHPKLACVCAVFEDPSRGSAFVQMPWYGGGNLGQWLEAMPPGARSVDQCRRLLSDAAEAVEHLHRHGFVHCDIKPSNMLLTKSKRLVLGDFDAVTTAEATLTRSLAGGTLGFIAPELTSGQQHYFTPATDIYALGIVAQKLLRDVEGAGDQGLEHMQELINMMSSHDPSMRPSAVDVCLHGALRGADGGGTEAENPRSCVVCWEIRQAGAGEQCSSSSSSRSTAADATTSSSSSHFTCSDCLSRYVASVARSSPARKVELAEEHGRLGCPAEGCQGHLEPAAVLRHLDSEAADQYHAALHDGLEGRVRTLLQADFDAQLQRLQDRLQEAQGGAMEERALQAEQTAIEDILTIKCPRCKAAILDFDGCFALKCTQCGAGLCGWCMQDCGNDSHPHVAICRHKPSHGKYRYFAPKQLFEDAANRRRAKAVAEYVNNRLPEDVRELVKERLRPHLRRLGIERKVKW